MRVANQVNAHEFRKNDTGDTHNFGNDEGMC